MSKFVDVSVERTYFITSEEVPGFLTLAGGSNVDDIADAENSVVILYLYYSTYNSITLDLEGSEWTPVAGPALSLGSPWGSSYGVFAMMANASDVNLPIEIPISKPPGVWVRGIALLVKNAKTSPHSVWTPVIPSGDLSSGFFTHTITDPLPTIPHRRVGFLLLFGYDSSGEIPMWLDEDWASDIEGFSFHGPYNAFPHLDTFVSVSVIPDPLLVDPSTMDSWTQEIEFNTDESISFHGALLTSIGIVGDGSLDPDEPEDTCETKTITIKITVPKDCDVVVESD